jgi:hypothetical protein
LSRIELVSTDFDGVKLTVTERTTMYQA